MNAVLERLRAVQGERWTKRPPSPARLSVTRMAMDAPRAYDRNHRLDRTVLEERFFPEIVRQVRENFMLDVRFSSAQWHWFVDWIERKGIPINLHCVSSDRCVTWIENPRTGEDTSHTYYLVRLMDIHWMWVEMA